MKLEEIDANAQNKAETTSKSCIFDKKLEGI